MWFGSATRLLKLGLVITVLLIGVFASLERRVWIRGSQVAYGFSASFFSPEHPNAGRTIRVSDFVESLGVNTHMHYTDGDYADFKAVLDNLRYLGMRHVRDGVPNPDVPGWGALNYRFLAEAGFKFNLIASGGDVDLKQTVELISTFARAYPGSLVSIEGPNEVNNWPVKFAGLTGDVAAVAFQGALYDAVKADPLLQHLPVYNLTSWPSLVGKSDFSNFHTYSFKGNQPYADLKKGVREFRTLMPGKQVVVTEIGYYTLPKGPGWGGVDEDTQAKMTLNLVFDAALLGVRRTYIYQLLDAYPDPNGTDMEKHFGLFDINHQPKPAAIAMHNLTSILRDPGSNASSFVPVSLGHEIADLPTTAKTIMMQKSSGAFILVIWNEPDIWDESEQVAIPAPSTNVSISFDLIPSSVKVFDPIKSADPISVSENVSRIVLDLADRPLLIEIEKERTNSVPASEEKRPGRP
jgi:hypothetical protein